MALAQDEQPVFLKLEDGDPYISVFRTPGQNWKYCDRDEEGKCKDGIGWLGRDAKVWVVGNKVMSIAIDPLTNQEVEEEYYPVQFEYTREVNGKVYEKKKGPVGYIEAAYVEFEKVKPIYSQEKVPTEKKPDCDPQSEPGHNQVKDITKALELNNLNEVTALIKDRIGFCSDIKNDNVKSGNLYDSVILPKMRSMTPPRIMDENGRYITNDQLIDIDSLARTLYGEMASCYKHGLQYPLAVARIAVNRSENKARHKEFIRGRHVEAKPQLASVVTSASQFNVWLRKLESSKNPSTKMALCPPRDPNSKMWTGSLPSKQELAIWNHTVRIATEAVLFPTSFKKRTDRLKSRYFYTSGMGKFFNMRYDGHAQVENRKIDNRKCVEIWHEAHGGPGGAS